MKGNDQLQVDRDRQFADTERRVQRIGIGVLTLFVIAGSFGVFGNGPLSSAAARATNIEVEYERFTRMTARNTIVVMARAVNSPARIAFDKTFFDGVTIEEIRPPQVELESDDRHVVFLVPAHDGVARLELHIEHETPGFPSTRVALDGGESLDIRQVVYF